MWRALHRLTVVTLALAVALALAPHPVQAAHGSALGASEASPHNHGLGHARAAVAPGSHHHSDGSPCLDDVESPGSDHAKSPHECCAAACHVVAAIDDLRSFSAVSRGVDVPVPLVATLREAIVGILDPPPRTT
jgi:uncharacterized protein involved in copper resistance